MSTLPSFRVLYVHRITQATANPILSSNFSKPHSVSRRAVFNKSWIRRATSTISFEPPRALQKVGQQVSRRVIRIQATGKSMETNSPRTVSVQVALELVQAGHHYLDVRTPEEFNAGHVEDATNVPYMFSAGEGMAKNSNFIQEVLSHFNKDDEIVVGCQSGRRSLMAAKDLMAAEFTGITDVGGGYSAWVQSGLSVKGNA